MDPAKQATPPKNASVVHGGPDLAELRALSLASEDILDFSASVTPLGTPQRVREAIASVDPSRYPDRECFELRNALSQRLGLCPDRILVGNGSTDLIHLTARAFVRPGQKVLIFAPTFGEYAAAAMAQEAVIAECRAALGIGSGWGLTAVAEQLHALKPALTFLCNPNNPTGHMLDAQAVTSIAERAKPGLLLVDEAYMPLADHPWDALPLLAANNVLILRSMTKEYGLAGVRLGYLVGPPPLIRNVSRLQPSWNVNSVAQAAGIAALECEDHVQKGRRVIAAGKRYLLRELPRMGLKALPSAANFLLLEANDPARLRARLLKHRVLVRDCSSFGLPGHIRISVRGKADCAILLRALHKVLADG